VWTKIVAWWQALPTGLRYGLIGFVCGAVVCAGVYTVVIGNAVHALGERQATVDANLAELVRENKDGTAKLDSLGTSVAGIQSATENNGSAIRKLNGSVESLTGSVGTIVARIGRIETGQGNVDQRLSELASGLSGIRGQISSIDGSISDIAGGLQSAQGILSGTDADIDAASSILFRLQKIGSGTENQKSDP